jgi:hypothetical protein
MTMMMANKEGWSPHSVALLPLQLSDLAHNASAQLHEGLGRLRSRVGHYQRLPT